MGRVTRLVTRRTGAVGMALTAWDLWRRIPPHHRRRIMRQARKHGPAIAKRVVQARRKPKL